MPTVTVPNTNIKVTVEPEKAAVKVRMLEDSEGKNKLKLHAGKEYDLPQDSADFQVRLGRATYVQAEESQTEEASTETMPADPESMTVATLTDELTAEGVEIPSGSLKADLVDLVKQNRKAK